MHLVKLKREAESELHEQAAAQIRRAIAEGEARPGDRLPPAGDLAAVLGINRNTVLRALRTLRDEGLLEFQRGRGVTVASDHVQGLLVERARELLAVARQQGYGFDDLVELLAVVSAT